MTDPALWSRLCAVTAALESGPVDPDGPDLSQRIEAGLKLHPGHGATLWQEYVSLVYLEVCCKRKPKPSEILGDLVDWLGWEEPQLRQAIITAAKLPLHWKSRPMTSEETRAAYRFHLGHDPVPQVWPRDVPGQGKRGVKAIGAALILAAVAWRLTERMIENSPFPVVPLWLPGVLAVGAGLVVWLITPRGAARDPVDAFHEGEAG